MKVSKPFILAWLSAIITLLAFPSFNLIPCLFFGLVPFFLALEEARTPRQAFRLGNAFGLIYMLGQLYFIFTLAHRWTGNFALALIPWIACGLAGMLFFGLMGITTHRLTKLNPNLIFLVPLLWAGAEVFRSQINFIGFPWGLLATPLWRYPMFIGVARYLTVYGVSAWIVAINLAIFCFIKRDFNANRWLAGASLVLLGVSILQFRSPLPAGENMRVACLQPGVDQAFGDAQVQEDKQADAIRELLGKAIVQKPDLVVLPEGVDRLYEAKIPSPPFPIPNIPIIFGAQRGIGPIYQSVFGFDGKTWTHADKTRLVIFGEYVPLRQQLGFDKLFNLAAKDIEPGHRVDPLTLEFPPTDSRIGGKTIVGPLVCYEGLFYDCAQAQAANGARLLAVVSIDDWFMGSAAPEQLEAAAVFRSVETNLPSVRAASTGHTMACDAHGNLLGEIPIQVAATLPVVVPIPDKAQPGWWLGLFPFVSFASFVAGLFARPEKNQTIVTSQEPEVTSPIK